MNVNNSPSINLKNINYINCVENYERSKTMKSLSLSHDIKASNKLFNRMAKNTSKLNEDYFEKYTYLMEEGIIESFRSDRKIPSEDKRVIENIFNKELKLQKNGLNELKETMKRLYAENNQIYYKIERINDNILVICL